MDSKCNSNFSLIFFFTWKLKFWMYLLQMIFFLNLVFYSLFDSVSNMEMSCSVFLHGCPHDTHLPELWRTTQMCWAEGRHCTPAVYPHDVCTGLGERGSDSPKYSCSEVDWGKKMPTRHILNLEALPFFPLKLLCIKATYSNCREKRKYRQNNNITYNPNPKFCRGLKNEWV